MKKLNTICEPPDDGREWMLADDAAALLGVKRDRAVVLAKRFNWTRYQPPHQQTWILKSDVVSWYKFLKDRELWYKRRCPKNWKPEIAMNATEDEELFKRIYWSTAQAAAFMGVTTSTIYKWTKKGKIPVFLTRKMGEGGKNWYSPTSLRNLKESEEWQQGCAAWERAKATMRQGIVEREVYTARHKPCIYQGIPPGWITLREVAERLHIGRSAAYRLRKMNRFMSEQFVGEWDTKKRPWFCDEDGVERLKNSEEYQQLRQRGKNAMQVAIGKPVETTSSTSPQQQSEPEVCLEPTFGYNREELRLPSERIVLFDELW